MIKITEMEQYPSIEDFFTDGEVVVIPDTVEKKINDYINEYSSEVELCQFEAVMNSRNIFLNC